jgi:diketogulonate reductase-like aldo/keto reductase
MQSIALESSVIRTPALGFGCSAVMGRVGRKASLAALSAAYDAGVIFFDTARFSANLLAAAAIRCCFPRNLEFGRQPQAP